MAYLRTSRTQSIATRPPRWPYAVRRDDPLAADLQLFVTGSYPGIIEHDLHRPQYSATTGPLTPSVDPMLGEGFSIAGTTTRGLFFSGRSTAALTTYTLAAMMVWVNSGNNFPQLIATSTANNGVRIGASAAGGGNVQLVKGGIWGSSPVVITANVPYFVVASHDQGSGAYALMVRRMDSFVLAVGSGTSTDVSTAGNGTFAVGNGRTDFSGSWAGFVSMGMISFKYHKQAALEDWALQPWRIVEEFNRRTYFIPAAVGGSFQAAWARGANTIIQAGPAHA